MTEKIILGGGCFWCLEAIFKEVKGVVSVVSGYAGGDLDFPTYEQVSSGQSGHAEVTEIEFNPEVISLKDLFNIFFLTHDPTTPNQQGADVGPQYRSVIFYNNQDQKTVALDMINEITLKGIYSNPIVTEVKEFTKFFKAEDYHQNFYKNNKDYPYCKIVIDPKIQKLKKEFSEKLNA
jgi:peptide-methionine (S)-S-oxide reductase